MCSRVKFLVKNKNLSKRVYFLLANSLTCTERSRCGLLFFFKLLRLTKFGNKSFFLNQSTIIHFLIDLLLFANTKGFLKKQFNIVEYNFNIIPHKNKHFTITRGPMARKKQSREQFSYYEKYLNIKKKYLLFNNNKTEVVKRGIKNSKELKVFLNSQINVILDKSTSFHSIFSSYNYNIYLFLKFLLNIKHINLYMDNSGISLKKHYSYASCFDNKYFFYKAKYVAINFLNKYFFRINLFFSTYMLVFLKISLNKFFLIKSCFNLFFFLKKHLSKLKKKKLKKLKIKRRLKELKIYFLKKKTSSKIILRSKYSPLRVILRREYKKRYNTTKKKKQFYYFLILNLVKDDKYTDLLKTFLPIFSIKYVFKLFNYYTFLSSKQKSIFNKFYAIFFKSGNFNQYRYIFFFKCVKLVLNQYNKSLITIKKFINIVEVEEESVQLDNLPIISSCITTEMQHTNELSNFDEFILDARLIEKLNTNTISFTLIQNEVVGVNKFQIFSYSLLSKQFFLVKSIINYLFRKLFIYGINKKLVWQFLKKKIKLALVMRNRGFVDVRDVIELNLRLRKFRKRERRWLFKKRKFFLKRLRKWRYFNKQKVKKPFHYKTKKRKKKKFLLKKKKRVMTLL